TSSNPFPGTETYCVIIRDKLDEDTYDISLEHIERNSTKVFVKTPHYISVQESIMYDESEKYWYTRHDEITYGCNWDLCNKPEIISLLPNSFDLRLRKSWLDENILENPTITSRDCHECSDFEVCADTQFFIDESRCPVKSCSGTCFVKDRFDKPDSTEFCYNSKCTDDSGPGNEINKHKIILEAIWYLDEKKLDLWEIDVFCRADDCSRIEIFDEIRKNLISTINVDDKFYDLYQQTTNKPPTTDNSPTVFIRSTIVSLVIIGWFIQYIVINK
ncbi:unnamed protein product, partial [Didymodactylos carnosus]